MLPVLLAVHLLPYLDLFILNCFLNNFISVQHLFIVSLPIAPQLSLGILSSWVVLNLCFDRVLLVNYLEINCILSL